MEDFYLGTILPVAFEFAPPGWALCRGQKLDIDKYPRLFELLGTAYGGDGKTNFGLPDLCGRFPIGAGQSANPTYPLPVYERGNSGGNVTATLKLENLPAHTHDATVEIKNTSSASLKVSKDSPSSSTPQAGMLPAGLKAIDASGSGSGSGTVPDIYGYAANSLNYTLLPAVSLQHVDINVNNSVTGENRAFDILNPYLSIYFIIAIEGEFPRRDS